MSIEADLGDADLGAGRTDGRVPVMADVARLAGVSQKTVSRVINEAPHVRDVVRDRVLAAVAELGYRPNAAARALVTQQSRVLGVAMPGSTDYGPSAQVFGIETAAWDLGYSVVVASAPASAEGFARAVARLVAQGVAGLVLNDPYVHHGLSTRALQTLPTVNVGEALCPGTVCAAVTVDQEGGARQAVEHLLSLGHRTVHHLAGPVDQGAAVRRAEGWREALVRAGACVTAPLVGDWSARSGYEQGRRLAGDPDVTAVFAANDQMAVGAMRAFIEAGRDVPADVSVVGFDDAPDSAYQVIPLTTVRQDVAAVSRRAVTALVAAIEGQPWPAASPTSPAFDAHPLGGQHAGSADAFRFPVGLVIRASTGPPGRRPGGPSP
ncbi:LacI family DNA-binding transcriptional regulator [Cellulomonas sp. ATA003]|uniref:LacI family DNA-binding transcriptional regulator n=1 Tax=Cellulomonas sp. ATA003 TaxID=3073064 RepID=UPI002873A19D|nr:LacI family DNA-binding transcriptional regulator [Cellulomonas sp. ATA003]WNB86091.1 LacI family DNA-binding transcriptional regulator [Cellulomonas sp. ATA003]